MKPVSPSATPISDRSSLSPNKRSTFSFFRRHFWLWPIIGAIFLGSIGFLVRREVENTVQEQLTENLQAILAAEVKALDIWFKDRKGEVESLVRDRDLIRLSKNLIGLTEKKTPFPIASLEFVESLHELRTYVKEKIEPLGYVDFFIVDPEFRVVGSLSSEAIGAALTEYRKTFFRDVFDGEVKVSLPYPSRLALQDESGELKRDLPTMLAAAPLIDEGKPFGCFAFRIRPDADFTKIVSVASAGKSGQTYAFNQEGKLISQSPFDHQLREIGLLKGPRSILTIEVRDPGINLVENPQPDLDLDQKPFTSMFQRCISQKSRGESIGIDVGGYRDYRGVPVIGAWQWLKEYEFGIATETEVEEAYAPVWILRLTFGGLFGLLVLSAFGLLILMILLDRRQRALLRAVSQIRQLGQYTLDEKLGSGGMGSVYKAHHQLMRRPTAVKLLDLDRISDIAIARFEREVQLTCLLNHPNTIAIYDFGRTPEGIFYYAMEYLEGIDLEQLVEQYGPQIEPRVVHLLMQICGSLAEAHRMGLIHRDIKPANIMMTDRGGVCDFVKVLDFGLVKAIGEDEASKLTGAKAFTGTPLYLSPEAIESPGKVDQRADLYALGAVAYFLLTGTPPFPGETIVEICMRHIREEVESPSKRLGKPIASDLERIVIQCLSKKMEDRPNSAEVLAEWLSRCEGYGQWTPSQARSWWDEWKEHQPAAIAKRPTSKLTDDITARTGLNPNRSKRNTR